MAFSLSTLSMVRRLRGNLSLWGYTSTGDDPTVQAAANYFNGAVDRFRVGDVICTYGAGTPQLFAVSGNTGSVITVVPVPTAGGGGGSINNDNWVGTDLAVVNGGTGASDATTARTNLGVGAIGALATINGSNWSGQDLAVVDGGTGGSTAAAARTNLGLGALATEGTVDNADWDGAGADLAVANGGTGASTAAAARTNLGLGTLATESAIDNADWSGADLAVANGGTGASDAATARTNLGVGTVGALNTINNDQWSGTDLTIANGGTGASDAATARTNLGIGAATEAAAGIVELATIAENNTGTDNTRAVSPDSLAGSYAGTAVVSLALTNLPTDDMVVGDGRAGFLVTPAMNGMNLVYDNFQVATAGTTGASTAMIRRRRSGADVDMLSAALSIASGATTSTGGGINAANDDLATGDFVYADVDALATTRPKGGMVSLEFRLP